MGPRKLPRWPPVHPRIRGERVVCKCHSSCHLGSSPHTRGTLDRYSCFRDFNRFIPAYAGNARPRAICRRRQAVHPRIRGERPKLPTIMKQATGSSPHTRGTRPDGCCTGGLGRFIPAYAGNARERSSDARPETVHPRIRGERDCAGPAIPMRIGSSPHTRGTPRLRHRPDVPQRFIPAYAGNAQARAGLDRLLPVHPRIRGEREFLQHHQATGEGSSPHTRGTPRPASGNHHDRRFIPAYAGNALTTSMI